MSLHALDWVNTIVQTVSAVATVCAAWFARSAARDSKISAKNSLAQQSESAKNDKRRFIYSELKQNADKASLSVNNQSYDDWDFKQAADLTNVIESTVNFMESHFVDFTEDEISKFKNYFLLNLSHSIRVVFTGGDMPPDVFYKNTGYGQDTVQEALRVLESFDKSRRYFGFDPITEKDLE